MIEVTHGIKKIISQRNAEVLSGSEATYKLLVDVNRQVRDELAHAALGSWNEYSLKQLKSSLERRIADFESAAKGDLGKRLTDMFDLGQESVYKPLNVGGIYTGFNIPVSVVRQMREFAFIKIDSYTGAMWDGIRGELSLAALGAKTPQQVSEAIGTLLPEGPFFGRGGRTIFRDAVQRGEFITKTELGKMYSEAANRRMTDAAKYVEDLQKIWNHGHPKTPRLTHLAANGAVRPVNEPFPVQDKTGYKLMYPHDPSADFSEVAGCQCSHLVWAARWGKYPRAA